MGHEPETMTAEADSDDAALEQLMGTCKAHLGEKHPEMAGKSDDEIKQMITAGWKKEEAGAAGGGM